MRRVLFWGRFDPGYSRNRVVREVLRAAGFAIEEFHPTLSAFGDIEATLRGLKTPSFVWVPCFRLRDVSAAARWARRRGVPLIFDPLISAYQKQVFERRLFPAESAAARRLLAKERALFALADVVVADTDCHRAFFHDTLGVSPGRLATLTVGASGEFAPAPLPVRGAGEPREVLFYGSFIPLHGVETIVAAAKLTAGEPIRWTLLGDGPHKAACRRLAAGMDNVSFERPIPFERLCDRIHAADVLLGIFGDTSQAARVMPNKFFQSLASGRPVVTRTSAAYPAAVADSPAVRFVPPSDPAALAAAVRDLCATPGALDRAAADARALFDRAFSLDELAEQFRAAVRLAIPPADSLVSVIVPVYNVEKYLSRCLDSVMGQTYGQLEIICVNDGSTDASASILADYAAKDARIRVISQSNGGLSAARNAGLDVATGEWVMFVDSDDWIPPYAVEGFLKVAVESGARVVVSAGPAVDELKAARPANFAWTLERPALAKLVGRRKIQSSAWNKFYRRDVIGTRRFIEGIYFEDWPFVTELFGDLDAFALVRAPMCVYCKNGASITRSPFNEKKVESYLAGARHVTAYFAKHPWQAVAEKRCALALAMVIARVYKRGSREMGKKLVVALAASPELARAVARLPLKARWRLWCLRRSAERSPAFRLRLHGAAVLAALDRALTPRGIRFCVDFGTLLGLVRERGLLKHDGDMDIAVAGDTDPQILSEALEKAGFAFRRGFVYKGAVTELTFARGGIDVDFFWNFGDGARHWYFVCGRFDKSIRYPHGAKQIKKCFRPASGGLVREKFLGVEVACPVNAEQWLEREYGPGWRVPDAAWTIDPADPNRVLMDGFAWKFGNLRKAKERKRGHHA